MVVLLPYPPVTNICAYWGTTVSIACHVDIQSLPRQDLATTGYDMIRVLCHIKLKSLTGGMYPISYLSYRREKLRTQQPPDGDQNLLLFPMEEVQPHKRLSQEIPFVHHCFSGH